MVWCISQYPQQVFSLSHAHLHSPMVNRPGMAISGMESLGVDNPIRWGAGSTPTAFKGWAQAVVLSLLLSLPN